MNRYKLYLWTILGLAIFLFIAVKVSTPYLIKPAMIELINNQLISSKREAKEVSRMIEMSMEMGNSRGEIIPVVQETISNTNLENAFLSVFDWSGKLVIYPDKTKIGVPTQDQQATIIEDIPNALVIYDQINMLPSNADAKIIPPKLVYMVTVDHPDSDLLVAAHVNVGHLYISKNTLQSRYYTILLVIVLAMILFTLTAIRLISNYYEGQLEQKNLKLEDGVLNLSKLNASLESYQKNLSEMRNEGSFTVKEDVPMENVVKETSKLRLLTYVRNELLSIAIEEIAYIYVENTITYVIRKDGKRSTSNESLDQIFTSLDEHSFFRANRQIIVAISAIDKIIKFGNSKLKIEVNPTSEIDIVIGKNKAAAFKQWLDM